MTLSAAPITAHEGTVFPGRGPGGLGGGAGGRGPRGPGHNPGFLRGAGASETSSSYCLVPGSALGERADGGGVADPEQGELEAVASAGVGLAGEPVCAEILRGDGPPAHGLLDVAAADGLETAGGAPVDQQVRVGGGPPAGTAGATARARASGAPWPAPPGRAARA